MPNHAIIFDRHSVLDIPVAEIFKDGIKNDIVHFNASGKIFSKQQDCAFKLQVNKRNPGNYPQTRIDYTQGIPKSEVRNDGVVLGANGGRSDADFVLGCRIIVNPAYQRIAVVGSLILSASDPGNNLIFYYCGSLEEAGPLQHIRLVNEAGTISGSGDIFL